MFNSIREDRKLQGVGTFNWNHSLILNILGSNKDIIGKEAPIESRGFSILQHIFVYFDNQFGLWQQIRMFFKSCI